MEQISLEIVNQNIMNLTKVVEEMKKVLMKEHSKDLTFEEEIGQWELLSDQALEDFEDSLK